MDLIYQPYYDNLKETSVGEFFVSNLKNDRPRSEMDPPDCLSAERRARYHAT